jgi:type III restriction enzyme
MEGKVHALVAAVNNPNALKGIIVNGNADNEIQNHESANFRRKEFKALWDEINHKYVYTVHYDSKELIDKVIWDINANLTVTKLKYIVTTGEQGKDELGLGDAESTRTRTLEEVSPSEVEYDLVGEIAKGATLTRRSVAKILKSMDRGKLALFANNPEEFIRNVIRIIREQKATMIVEHISYNRIEGKYDSDIFTQERGGMVLASRAYPAKKHILDYVAWDSEKERRFAKDMDAGEEVCVYAKLPRSFHIPTPVGNYAPDWAVAFNDKMGIKHVFFIAETKGSMSSMDLKPIEKAKIKCTKNLFAGLSDSKVRYHEVTDYQTMLQILEGMK